MQQIYSKRKLKVSLHLRSKRIFAAGSTSVRSLKRATTSHLAWQNYIKTCWFKQFFKRGLFFFSLKLKSFHK